MIFKVLPTNDSMIVENSTVHLSLALAPMWAFACWKAATLVVFLLWSSKAVESKEGLKLISLLTEIWKT